MALLHDAMIAFYDRAEKGDARAHLVAEIVQALAHAYVRPGVDLEKATEWAHAYTGKRWTRSAVVRELLQLAKSETVSPYSLPKEFANCAGFIIWQHDAIFRLSVDDPSATVTAIRDRLDAFAERTPLDEESAVKQALIACGMSERAAHAIMTAALSR